MTDTNTWEPIKWSHSGLKNFETWRPVVGYEGHYEVSSFGRVRSVTRTHTVLSRWGRLMQRTRVGRPMPTYEDPNGYAQVRLCKNGKSKTTRVSRMVLTAFVGVPQPGDEAGHRDDNPANNTLCNLEWVSRLQNEVQKTQRGRRPESTAGKLDRNAAVVIRDMRASGFRLQEIAALFNCHFSNVGYICQNKTWRQ